MVDYEEKNLLAFAAKLKRARMNAGLTQQELAHLSGCKQFDITRYENAIIFPQDDTILVRMAEALKVDPYYLRFNGGDSYTIKETDYGKELRLNHISKDYIPAGEELSIYERGKQDSLKNDRTFIQYLKTNLGYLTEDDRSAVMDFVRMLVLDKPEGQVIIEEQMEENRKYINGHLRFSAPRIKKK